MFFDHFKSSPKILPVSPVLFGDSNSGGSRPDPEHLQQKIEVAKSRRIPYLKFILLLAAIAVTIAVLEYFI